LHEAGSTEFFLQGTASIPEWFEHQSRETSISFWFRNKLPAIALFFVGKIMIGKCGNGKFLPLKPYLHINGYKYALDYPGKGIGVYRKIKPDHTYLYDLQLQGRELDYNLGEALLINEWIFAEIRFESLMMRSLLTDIGIHVFKQKSSTEDIQLTNPYKNIGN
jgi:hypothetical protein